ncbi:MAG: hypothetical protein K9J17_13460 [Flavobacteriales bacterium]|nr:hypothetical protein [Flavobacteriales bacterium]
MIKLSESKLFGDRLYYIDNTLMQKRYNRCLEDIGIAPTELNQFHVDGWGWSPEIAREKDDRFYLSHGVANPFAIIISPDQKDCPVYMPYHTFDWEIHRRVFENYALQIEDITSLNAIWFELDQNISSYRTPQDLLMMEVVNLKFNVAGDLAAAAAEQKALVNRYMNDPRAWMNSKLREAIIESSKKHGDLRYRNLELPDFPFSNITAFYTLAFNGVFVFKKVMGGKPIMIFEDDASQLSGDSGHLHVEFNMKDLSFIPYLYNLDLLDSETDFFQEHIELLELQLEHMIVSAAMELDDTIPVGQMTPTQRKGLISKLEKAKLLDDRYFELEKVVNKLINGGQEKPKISENLNQFMLQPHTRTSPEQKRVLWHLISKIQNNNPVLQFAFDKTAFYHDYQTWKEPMKEWAINSILKHRGIYSKLIK